MKKAIGWIFLRLIAVAACVALAVFIYPMHLQSVVEGMEDAPEITVSSDLPLELVSGPWPYGHCQGIAVDEANGWVYYSFTTALVKTDFEGNMLGISVIDQSETAGLGAVCAAKTSAGEAFRGQFEGVSGTVAVSKDGGELDAITGATITSRAVCRGVNAALACAANLG